MVASMPGTPDAVGGSSGLASPASKMLSILFVVGAILAQLMVGFAARKRILKAKNEDGSPERRLRLLENQDAWLDLPLFIGLGGTILAFIFISLDAGVSRILAYSSTAAGIIVAVTLRMYFFQPAREALIRETSAASNES